MTFLEADESLIPPDQKILAAVSGGADSLALLWWLHEIGREIVVGHVHHDLHELRPGECEADFRFVRDKCESLKVPFLSRKIDLARKNGHVNEAAARDGRYAALVEMARESGCFRVATAHTATDNLETALLNLARGAGVQGLSGFSPKRLLDGEIWLVRPFWKVPRQKTREILRQNGWEWREDASNLDPIFRRNRVRHEILPLLEEISGRQIDDLALQFGKNAALARDESEMLEKWAEKALETLVLRRESEILVLDGLKFQELEAPLQRRVLRRAARVLNPDWRDLGASKVEEVRQTVQANRKRRVWDWRNDLKVEWTGALAGNRIRFWRVGVLSKDER